MNRNFAYLRVSTSEQNVSRQLDAISSLNEDIEERDIYIDKVSGKDFNRPEYQALKRALRPFDTIFVKSVDRIGCNKAEILKEWQWLIDNKIDIVVLDMPLLDTRRFKELEGIGVFITDLVLQILSWLAEEERKNIRNRQAEGIKCALKNGIKFGRPKVILDEKFKEYYGEWKKGNMTAVKVMESLNIKRNTFYRRVKEYEDFMVKN